MSDKPKRWRPSTELLIYWTCWALVLAALAHFYPLPAPEEQYVCSCDECDCGPPAAPAKAPTP